MKGSYILVIKLKEDSEIKIGSLGLISFPRGYYCYVGSALGNIINLENRVGRHKKLNREKEGKLHWHIDYFLVNPNALIIQIVMIKNEKRMECEISKKLEKIAKKSIQGFGSSDCKCKSHFHYFDNKENYEPEFGNLPYNPLVISGK